MASRLEKKNWIEENDLYICKIYPQKNALNFSGKITKKKFFRFFPSFASSGINRHTSGK